MKALILLAGLAVAASAQSKAPLPAKDSLLGEISAWRERLPHSDPLPELTRELEPRLDRINDAAQAAPDEKALAQPRKDFEAWKHDFVLKDYHYERAGGARTGTLNRFSKRERAEVAEVVARQQRLTAGLQHAAMTAETQARMFYDGGGSDAGGAPAGSFVASPPARVTASGQPAGLHIADTPPPPPAAKPFSWSSISGYFDTSGISDSAVQAVENIKNRVAGYGKLLSGFAGSCYYGAKWLLIKAHVLPPEVEAPEEIAKIGIGSGHAYMMNAALKRSPALQAKLHVRRLDLATLTDADAPRLPEKTTFVFDRGCAGMSDESGHIEVVLGRDKMDLLPAKAFYRAGRHGLLRKPTPGDSDVLACSDGCALRSAAYLRTYGRQGCLNAYVPVSDGAAPGQIAASSAE